MSGRQFQRGPSRSKGIAPRAATVARPEEPTLEAARNVVVDGHERRPVRQLDNLAEGRKSRVRVKIARCFRFKRLRPRLAAVRRVQHEDAIEMARRGFKVTAIDIAMEEAKRILIDLVNLTTRGGALAGAAVN